MDEDVKKVHCAAVACLQSPYKPTHYLPEHEFLEHYPGISSLELVALADHYMRNRDPMAPYAFAYTGFFYADDGSESVKLVNPKHLMQYVRDYDPDLEFCKRMRSINYYGINLDSQP